MTASTRGSYPHSPYVPMLKDVHPQFPSSSDCVRPDTPNQTSLYHSSKPEGCSHPRGTPLLLVPYRQNSEPSKTDMVSNEPLSAPSRPRATSLLPTPLTGHDLMALWPAPPPVPPLCTAGATSHCFRMQEREFFARPTPPAFKLWEEYTPAEQERLMLAQQQRHQTHNRTTHSDGSYPLATTLSHSSPPRQQSLSTAPPSHQLSSQDSAVRDDDSVSTYDDSGNGSGSYTDESWRTPIPYGERRRAGKHTRRVVVRT